jgi:hypothetical protein
MSGPRQHATVVATHRTGTHHCYLHRLAHSILFLLIGGSKNQNSLTGIADIQAGGLKRQSIGSMATSSPQQG